MKRIVIILFSSLMLGLASASAQTPRVEASPGTLPEPAREMPQASSKREQLGVSGYHHDDSSEDTQERPNPLMHQQPGETPAASMHAPASRQTPVPLQQQPPGR